MKTECPVPTGFYWLKYDGVFWQDAGVPVIIPDTQQDWVLCQLLETKNGWKIKFMQDITYFEIDYIFDFNYHLLLNPQFEKVMRPDEIVLLYSCEDDIV